MKTFFATLALVISLSVTAQPNVSTVVYFDFDRYNLTPASVDELNRFLEKNKSASTQIELYGHCDFKGNDNYNDALSIKRVQSVKNYLINAGISSENVVITKGHGKRLPLNNNATAPEQQLNRRVEIKLVSKPNKEPEQKKKKEEPDITLKKKLADSTITAGSNIVLRNINFVGGMRHFLPESMPMLEELLDAMNTYPNLIIEVQGHICCQPDEREGLNLETANYTLSADRARAVREYLVLKGIAQHRVSSKGFGHSVPLYPYPEKSDAERVANRRVEIKIISK